MVFSDYLLTGASVFAEGRFRPADLAVSSGKVVAAPPAGFQPREIRLDGLLLLPGFADVHVHFREPGFAYKETIATGSAAAAAGGYTEVFTMPNLDPVPDSPESLRPQLEAIARSATVRVRPFGAITHGEKGREIADLEALAPFVAGFSDDGRGVQDAGLMREAMGRAKALGKPVAAHCEVDALLAPGGCVHDGAWARAAGLAGLSSESEWKMVERDLGLVRETGCRYHVCHVSTREGVALVRAAKADGLPVSCETAPHYLVLADADLGEAALGPGGGRFKMNPPVRSAADREALLEGLLDGTIDCVATDHAPHSAEEKSRGLRGSAFGVVGLETAFPVLYTRLVQTGLVPLATLVDRLAIRPREIFGGEVCRFRDGDPASFTAVRTGLSWKVEPAAFRSLGRATPFEGWDVSAQIALTFCDGRVVHPSPASPK